MKVWAMTEATTAKPDEAKEDGSGKSNIILQGAAGLLFILNLAVSVVIMLLPLNLLYGKFQRDPQRVLWILFTLSLAFAILNYTLGVAKTGSRESERIGGIVYLVLGLLCAIEIFILAAKGTASEGPVTTSLWWLFAVYTVLGAICVYLPERARRLKEEEEKCKAKAALLRERGKRPIVLRLKARHYYVYENKLILYTD
jgi:hypothetical protein